MEEVDRQFFLPLGEQRSSLVQFFQLMLDKEPVPDELP